MTCHRFYMPDFKITEGELEIKNLEQIRQIRRVLRLKIKDRLIVFDGKGKEKVLEISEFFKNKIRARFLAEQDSKPELGFGINLFQAIISKDKFELVVQKATELGATKIIPVITAFSQPFNLRAERLRKIAIEAAEQSERSLIPAIEEKMDFREALQKAGSGFIAWEGEKQNSFENLLKDDKISKKSEVNLFIGPEGGFTREEVKLAKELGFKTFSLGPRTLRAETAAIAAISLLACWY